MNKKIIFINPPLEQETVYSEFTPAGSLLPPIGLCTLASVIRNKGYNVKIIDLPALKLGYEEAVKIVRKEKPDYVGITAVTLSINNGAKLARLIKRNVKNTKIILGGPHITSLPIKTMQNFKEFDIGVIGEAEETLPEILIAIDKGIKLNKIRGIVIRKNGKIILTRKRPFIKDLDKLPIPAWDLLPPLSKTYKPAAVSFKRLPSSILITSRGCSGKCTFCDTSVFGSEFRAFSAKYIFNMIQELNKRYGIKDIFFNDDTFTVSRKRIIELCNLIIKNKLDITWSCNTRINYVDKELLRLMKKAGCWQIAYGIESGSQQILNKIKKGITINQINESIKLAKKAGLKVKGYFIIGFPDDTKQSIEETIRFILSSNLDFLKINFFTPYPGCQDYITAKKSGLFKEEWSKMNQFNCVYTPPNLTKNQIQQYMKNTLIKFYLTPKRLLSNLGLIVNIRQFMAGVRVIWNLKFDNKRQTNS